MKPQMLDPFLALVRRQLSFEHDLRWHLLEVRCKEAGIPTPAVKDGWPQHYHLFTARARDFGSERLTPNRCSQVGCSAKRVAVVPPRLIVQPFGRANAGRCSGQSRVGVTSTGNTITQRALQQSKEVKAVRHVFVTEAPAASARGVQRDQRAAAHSQCLKHPTNPCDPVSKVTKQTHDFRVCAQGATAIRQLRQMRDQCRPDTGKSLFQDRPSRFSHAFRRIAFATPSKKQRPELIETAFSAARNLHNMTEQSGHETCTDWRKMPERIGRVRYERSLSLSCIEPSPGGTNQLF